MEIIHGLKCSIHADMKTSIPQIHSYRRCPDLRDKGGQFLCCPGDFTEYTISFLCRTVPARVQTFLYCLCIVF